MLHPAISVVIPARDEEATIGDVVRSVVALGRDAAAEVLVVDDSSSDRTAATAAAAGAKVVAAALGPGKGQAMWQGLREAAGDLIVFCDADLAPFDPSYVTDLARALLRRPGAALVKGRYHRSGTGGRVNELVARPSLELLHPPVAHLAQPLGGEYAAWREVLEQVPFVHGYGVDLGLVLDVAGRFGAASVIETDLGVRTHRNRSLEELRPQAAAVLEVALQRAGVLGRTVPECPPLCTVPGYVRRTA